MDLQDLDGLNSRSHSDKTQANNIPKQPTTPSPKVNNSSKKQPTKGSAIAKLQQTSNQRGEALATAKQSANSKITEAGYKSGRKKAQTYSQADNLGLVDGILLHEIDQAEQIGLQLELLDELTDETIDVEAIMDAGDPLARLLNHSISLESINQQFSTELSLLPSSEKSEN